MWCDFRELCCSLSSSSSFQSTKQVYRRLLDIHHETELYAASMGFLVRDDLHRMYDRYEWSWYCKVSRNVPEWKAFAHHRLLDTCGVLRMASTTHTFLLSKGVNFLGFMASASTLSSS